MTTELFTIQSRAQQDIFQAYQPGNADQLPTELLGPENLWTGISLRARVIMNNTELVSAQTLARAIARLCQVGYAIPDVIIALSLVLLVNRSIPVLYATPLIVVLAYVLRNMPQAVCASEAALSHLSPSLDEVASTLGRNSLQTLIQVTLPLAFPGLLAGEALVFLTSLKELPATLLLRLAVSRFPIYFL